MDTLHEKTPTKHACIEKEFESLSDYNPNIHDHRFSSGLHVSLQVKAFRDSLDFVQEEDELESKYYKVAASLMQKVSLTFTNELHFQDMFLEEVKELLPHPIINPNHHAFWVSKGHAVSDATIQMTINKQSCNLANWVFKKELNEDYLRPNPMDILLIYRRLKTIAHQCSY